MLKLLGVLRSILWIIPFSDEIIKKGPKITGKSLSQLYADRYAREAPVPKSAEGEAPAFRERKLPQEP